MFKLLVNTPSGEQQIIKVKETGGYFDDSCVIWDERKDGSLPNVTVGGLLRVADNLVFDQARQDTHNTAILPLMSAEVRTERDAKLAETDWTQVADAPVDQAAWATYRQALRDIPDQAGFPTEVNWPIEP